MKVYDLINAGPRHRFLVRPKGGGAPLLVANCTMGVEADIMNHGLIQAEARGMPPFMLVHDQALALRLNGKTAADFAAALVEDLPAWAKGLPVKCDCRVAPYYQKG